MPQGSREKYRISFSSFSVLPFMAAGFIDGINPCSFAVLVFFIALLSCIDYREKEILVLGICFITAVFTTTLLLELGLFEAWRNLEIYSLLSRVTYLFVAGLSIILGLLNLYDWRLYLRSSDPSKFLLKLPTILRTDTQGTAADEAKTSLRGLIYWLRLGALTALGGFLIAFLVASCRGHLYLPTLVSMLGSEDQKVKIIASAVLYNFMAILPLLLVFLLVLHGVRTGKFTKTLQANLSKVKIIHAAVFIGLGLGLFYLFS